MAKQTLKSIQKEIWQECRRITKVKEATKCFTCGADLTLKSKQLGHFIPKAFCPMELKYDLRLLFPQCYFCNINLGGNGAVFYHNIECSLGLSYILEIFEDLEHYKSIKPTDKEKREYYLNLLKNYKNL